MHPLFEKWPRANTIMFLRCNPGDESSYELLRPYDDSEVELFETIYMVNRKYQINTIDSPRVPPKQDEKKKIYRLDKLKELLTIIPLLTSEPLNKTVYRF